MIQDDPERKLKVLQLLHWLPFLILSFDKLYSAINTQTRCRSELNIQIKSSLEIRGRFKFRNNQLPLSHILFNQWSPTLDKYINKLKGLCENLTSNSPTHLTIKMLERILAINISLIINCCYAEVQGSSHAQHIDLVPHTAMLLRTVSTSYLKCPTFAKLKSKEEVPRGVRVWDHFDEAFTDAASASYVACAVDVISQKTHQSWHLN